MSQAVKRTRLTSIVLQLAFNHGCVQVDTKSLIVPGYTLRDQGQDSMNRGYEQSENASIKCIAVSVFVSICSNEVVFYSRSCLTMSVCHVGRSTSRYCCDSDTWSKSNMWPINNQLGVPTGIEHNYLTRSRSRPALFGVCFNSRRQVSAPASSRVARHRLRSTQKKTRRE